MSNRPLVCSACDRAFAWGSDADSAIVEAQGPQWFQCRENAHWKLTFHTQAEHAETMHECARRAESMAGGLPGKDFWSKNDGLLACSYCGSLPPDKFFEAVEQGCEVIPTDKNYKAYIVVPNPIAGQQVVRSSMTGPVWDRQTGALLREDATEEEKRTGTYERKTYGPAGETRQAKFYFQHLSAADQQRFIDLLNAKKMRLGMPGHFYRRPFFCQAVSPQ